MNLCRSLAVAALFTLPLFAQETTGQSAAKTAAEPLLVVKTSHEQIGALLVDALGITDPLPDLGNEGHYAFAMQPDRSFAVAGGKGDVPVLEVHCQPGALMTAFAEELEASRAAVQTPLSVLLQQSGLTGKEAVLWSRAVWNFPRQLAAVVLRVTGDIEDPRVGGLDVELDLVPLADSSFAAFFAALAPCPEGVPTVPGKSPLAMQVSLAPTCLRSLCEPLLGLAAAMSWQGAELREQGAKSMAETLRGFDGGIGLALGGDPLGGRVLCGLRDAAAFTKLLASAEYQALEAQQKLANRNLELQVTHEALQHRGAFFARREVRAEDDDTPVAAGLATSLGGVVGGYWMNALGGGESLPKQAMALADSVLDGKIQRTPLAAGVLLRIAGDLPELVAMAARFLPDVPEGIGDELPSEVELTLGKAAGALRLKLHVQ